MPTTSPSTGPARLRLLRVGFLCGVLVFASACGPDLESANPDRRKAAVLELADHSVLARVALEDSSDRVRVAAIERLEDQEVLGRIASSRANREVLLAAIARLNDQVALGEAAVRARSLGVREAALERLAFGETDAEGDPTSSWIQRLPKSARRFAVQHVRDGALLESVVLQDTDYLVSRDALERIHDHARLARIALGAGSRLTRDRAWARLDVSRLRDGHLLLELALKAPTKQKYAAVDALSDPALLARVVRDERTPPPVALSAVQRIESQEILGQLVLDGPSRVLRLALKSVTRPEVLRKLFFESKDDYVCAVAFAGIDDQPTLLEIANSHRLPSVRIAAVDKLTDQDYLSRVATDGKATLRLRVAAVRRLERQDVLTKLACIRGARTLILAAVERISDPASLAKTVIEAGNSDVRRRALARLSDQANLAKVVRALHGRKSGVDRSLLERAVDGIDDPKILEGLPESNICVRERLLVCKARMPDGVLALAQRARVSRVRRWAVRRLTTQEHLVEVATRGRLRDGRIEAIKRLEDHAVLMNLVGDRSREIRAAAIRRLTDERALVELVLETPAARRDVVHVATRRLNRIPLKDQEAIKKLVLWGPPGVRTHALKHLRDARTLADYCIRSDARYAAGKQALESLLKTKDAVEIARVARFEQYESVALKALAHVEDEAELVRIARSGASPAARRNALKRLKGGHRALFEEVALGPGDARMRVEALRHVDDEDVLTKIALEDVKKPATRSRFPFRGARDDPRTAVQRAALERVRSIQRVEEIAARAKHSRIKDAARRRLRTLQVERVKTLTDQRELVDIACTSKDADMREAALPRITEPAALDEVAEKAQVDAVRRAAMRRVTNQALLGRLAEKGRFEAVGRVEDQVLLERLARKSKNEGVRQVAAMRISSQPVLARLALEAEGGARVVATMRLRNDGLLKGLARAAETVELRCAAIHSVQDQDFLGDLARTHPMAVIREAAVEALDSDALRLERVDLDHSPTVRRAAVQGLVDTRSILKAACEAYHGDVRQAALERLKRLADAEAIRAAEEAEKAIAAREAALATDAATALVEVAMKGSVDRLRAAAVERLASPSDLERVAMARNDRVVLRAVLRRLDDVPALRRVAQGAADPVVRVAASHKAGIESWNGIFSRALKAQDDVAELGIALGAVAMFAKVHPDAKKSVVQACLTLIRRGDEARIPELVDLLNLYGDKRLCEDYLNCGQPDLYAAAASWARKRGYNIGRGHGSARARWGGKR